MKIRLEGLQQAGDNGDSGFATIRHYYKPVIHRNAIDIRYHETQKITHARVKPNLKKLIFKVESSHEITGRNEFFNDG